MAAIISDSICRGLPVVGDVALHFFPGATCDRIDSILRQSPELVEGLALVILHVGTNDVASGTSVQLLCRKLGNLRELVLSLTAPGARVVLSGILPRLDSPQYQYVVRQTDRAMRRWLGNEFLLPRRFLHSNQPIAHLFSQDGLHLSLEGKQVLWRSFANILRRY